MDLFLSAVRRLAPLCLLCTFAALPSPACRAQSDIIPGHSAYKFRLGMTLAQAKAAAARHPDDVRHQKGGITVLDWDDGTLVLVRGGRVFQIEVANDNEATSDGLHGGDTLARVQMRYAPLRHTSYTEHSASKRTEPVDIYDAVNKGVAFEFAPSHGAGGSVVLESIIVHVPGRPVVPEADLRPRNG